MKLLWGFCIVWFLLENITQASWAFHARARAVAFILHAAWNCWEFHCAIISGNARKYVQLNVACCLQLAARIKYEPNKPTYSFYFSCGLQQSMNRPLDLQVYFQPHLGDCLFLVTMLHHTNLKRELRTIVTFPISALWLYCAVSFCTVAFCTVAFLHSVHTPLYWAWGLPPIFEV